MITRTPYDRDNLKIGKKDKVLEVGPGPVSYTHLTLPTIA